MLQQVHQYKKQHPKDPDPCHILSLRDTLRAPEGSRIIVSDLSQIEARMNAWLWGQDDLTEQFELGDDVYSIFASKLYGYTVTKANKKERMLGKQSILALGYGGAIVGFERAMGTVAADYTSEQKENAISVYRETNDKIVLGWRSCRDALQMICQGDETTVGVGIELPVANERIYLPNGLWLSYKKMHKRKSEKNGWDEFAYWTKDPQSGRYMWGTTFGGKVTENICQALARIVLTDMMLLIDKEFKRHPHWRASVAGQVHDEILVVGAEEFVDEIQSCMVRIMSNHTAKWQEGRVGQMALPLACEADNSIYYGDAK